MGEDHDLVVVVKAGLLSTPSYSPATLERALSGIAMRGSDENRGEGKNDIFNLIVRRRFSFN
jgi:hypothetical protein